MAGENLPILMTEFMTFDLKEAQGSLGAVWPLHSLSPQTTTSYFFADLTPPGSTQGLSVLHGLWWERPVCSEGD